MNNFDAIASFYKLVHRPIMDAKKNEWGIDPYEWDQGLIQMTPIESWFWHDIRAVDAVFYPQYPVAGFFVDFANPRAKVAIECDGAEFHQDKAKDAARDKRLTDAGWTVYRIRGKDCRDGVGSDSGSVARAFISSIANNHGLRRD
jgi:very-short-patch-repair endonuclease